MVKITPQKLQNISLEFQVSFEEKTACTFSPRSRFNAQMSCGTFGAACLCNTQSPKDTIRDPTWRQQLGAFSEIYAVYAQTADDEEFYVIGKPLTIDESKFLVEIAKNTLWFQLWENPFTNGGSLNNNSSNRAVRTEDSQIEATASVLQNLFDRNGRRQFAPPGRFMPSNCVAAWILVFSLAVDSFLREFGEGGRKSRASNVLSKCSCLAPFEVRVRAFGTATEKFRRQEMGNERRKFRCALVHRWSAT